MAEVAQVAQVAVAGPPACLPRVRPARRAEAVVKSVVGGQLRQYVWGEGSQGAAKYKVSGSTGVYV